MTKKKTYAVFFTLLAVGIALCIGGIWLGEALFVAGAAFIAGALGMCSQTQAFNETEATETTRPIPPQTPDIEAQREHHHDHNRPYHTQTILFSRQISGQDASGHHYRQSIDLRQEVEEEKSNETSYHTASGSSPRDNNRITNV